MVKRKRAGRKATCQQSGLRILWGKQQNMDSERSSNEVRDTLSQNMPLWHTDYFKLKEYEKMAEARRSLWPFSDLSPLKHVINPSCERCFSYTHKKRAFLPPKTKGWRILANRSAVSLVYYTYFTLLKLSYF